MASQLTKLEKSVIDLGAEVFRLRHEVAEMREFHGHIIDTVNGLRTLLQDKGSINAADFDSVMAGVDLMNSGIEPLDRPIDHQEQPFIRKRLSH